jgi:hypothetical protein
MLDLGKSNTHIKDKGAVIRVFCVDQGAKCPKEKAENRIGPECFHLRDDGKNWELICSNGGVLTSGKG